MARTPTHYFIDPLNGSDTTGDGSITNPWKSIEHAFATVTTRDTVNGDQFNIRDTAPDVISTSLTTNVNWPQQTVRTGGITIRGYSNQANDGGIGHIKCDNTGIVIEFYESGARRGDYSIFRDIKISSTNMNDGPMVHCRACTFINCEFEGGKDVSYDRFISPTANGNSFYYCYAHGFKENGLVLNGYGSVAMFNYIEATSGIHAGYSTVLGTGDGIKNASCLIYGNICYLNEQGYGIGDWFTSIIINNVVYSSVPNKSKGITITNSGGSKPYGVCINNIICGFSGVGGAAFRVATNNIFLYGYNVVYNCTSMYDDLNSAMFVVAPDWLDTNKFVYENPLADPENGNFTTKKNMFLAESSFPTKIRHYINQNKKFVGGVQPTIIRRKILSMI